MSRFDTPRWNRILVWTGAALAWSTALVVSRLEPARAVEANRPEPVARETADSPQRAIMPNPAPQGLVILRFTPVEAPQAEVRTVVVNRAPSGSNSPAPASAHAAPAPESSGS